MTILLAVEVKVKECVCVCVCLRGNGFVPARQWSNVACRKLFSDCHYCTETCLVSYHVLFTGLCLCLCIYLFMLACEYVL